MHGNVRGRAALAMGMVVIAVTSLSVRAITATAYSNRCDPGNARFTVLADDPVVRAPLSASLVSWQNRSPDNSWLCTSAHLSLNFIGTNPVQLYDQGAAALVDGGWQTLSDLPDTRFWDGSRMRVYQKPNPDGVPGRDLFAILRQEPYGLEIALREPGGPNLGQSGF